MSDFDVFEDAAVDQGIPARFAAQVARHPDRPAVVSAECSLTYAELAATAGRVARAVVAELGEGEEPVALLFGHGPGLIAAILGVLEAGKIYVALDAGEPDARQTYVLDDTQARLLLTDAAHRAQAEQLAGPRRVLDCDSLGAPAAAPRPGRAIAHDAGSLILYTSGSTGRPKGVLHSHRSILVDARNCTNDMRIAPADRLALIHSCSQANSVRNIYGALLNGAALCTLDLAAAGVPRLPAWLRATEITILHTLATTFRRLVRSLGPDDTFPALRVLRLGGEPISRDDVAEFQRWFAPSCVLMHAMGPTETLTVARHFITHDSRSAEAKVPVGPPMRDKDVLLLDEARREVPRGEVGEIAVRSRYLALGYWRRPDLTAAAFLPDPAGGDARIYLTGDLGVMRPDGWLVHMGRKDFQVKIRGQRVEVGEVEAALRGLPSVRAAIVHSQPQGGEPRLVAYVVPTAGDAPTVSELRRALAGSLPDYMVPTAFVFLDDLPQLPNGKVNRRGLPAPDRARPALDTPYAAPRTPFEQQLARLWSEALEVEPVGIHDHFLDLGGHSLLAGHVLARIVERFEIELTMQDVAAAPTVAELAAVLVVRRAAGADPDALAGLLTRPDTPSAT